MNHIEFNGKEFPSKTFNVLIDGEEQTITISTASLLFELVNFLPSDNDINSLSSEAEQIDNDIYFYVDDDKFDLSPSDICKNHLDEPIEFVSEEQE